MSTQMIILIILPLAVIELGLLAFALNDLIKRKKVKGGNKWVWAAVVVFISLIGPILYFTLGREEE
jgi:hypothetical protein